MTHLLHGVVAWALDSDDFQMQEISRRGKGDEVCKFRVALHTQQWHTARKVTRRVSIQSAMSNSVCAVLKIGGRKFSVTSSFDDTDERIYWLTRKPQARLRQLGILRRINYGNLATGPLPRVFEVALRESERS